MGIIAGAEAFAADMMIPDDGDNIEAGSVNIPFEALADRTVWLQSWHARSAAMRIACFDVQRTFASLSSTNKTGRPGYSKKKQRWYVTKPQTAYYTEVYGADWFNQTGTLQPGTSYHVAFVNDPLNARYGNGLFVPVEADLAPYAYTDSTSTFASSTVLPSATWTGVQHNAENDRWVAWSTGKLYTSPTNVVAWTARALPGGSMFPFPPVSNGVTTMVVGKNKGVYTSADLITWTECTTAFGLTDVSGLVWDGWRKRFLVVTTNAAGLCETWTTSDSGASWTLLASSIGVNYIFDLVSVGPAIVGVTLTSFAGYQHLVYSVDGGATWGRAPSPVSGLVDANTYLSTNGSDILAVGIGPTYKDFAFSRGFSPIAF